MNPIWQWTDHTLIVFAIGVGMGAKAGVERLRDAANGREASVWSVLAALASLSCAAWFAWTVLS